MLNKEKYSKEIFDLACEGKTLAIRKSTNSLAACQDMTCADCDLCNKARSCREAFKIWCNSEYTEPEVDWSKVPVDTPILVRSTEDDIWKKRYFSKYTDNDRIEAWLDGATSWSAEDSVSWEYAKLARKEDELLYSKN